MFTQQKPGTNELEKEIEQGFINAIVSDNVDNIRNALNLGLSANTSLMLTPVFKSSESAEFMVHYYTHNMRKTSS